uniref:Uncharacterized protein n=1 Tax=Romanomermis culicivorax TaxID=13658 RepID=A0A915IBD9_ROMCU
MYVRVIECWRAPCSKWVLNRGRRAGTNFWALRPSHEGVAAPHGDRCVAAAALWHPKNLVFEEPRQGGRISFCKNIV